MTAQRQTHNVTCAHITTHKQRKQTNVVMKSRNQRCHTTGLRNVFGASHPATEAELWDVWTDINCNDGRLRRHSQKHNRCWTSCWSSGGDPMIPHTFSLTPHHSSLSQRSGWTRTSNL